MPIKPTELLFKCGLTIAILPNQFLLLLVRNKILPGSTN